MADKISIPFRGDGKVTSTAKTLYDMHGNALPMTISTAQIVITDLDMTTLNIGGVAVTSTAAEINLMDVTAQAETIDSGDAISVAVLNTKLDNTTSGAGAITLAVPGAEMYGKIKTIEMTVDNGDTTLALTNVTGGSAATTCTFAAVDDALVLMGGTNKWHVIAESGVVLS
jgi:hypothetical protein